MTTQYRTASNAIDDFESIRCIHPFRGQLLSEQMGSYAACALDQIERQAGLDASLDAMLEVLQETTETRIRWARIITDREIFIVFRDLSMLTYREAPGNDEVTSGATLRPSGLMRDYSEDEMEQGLLPAALTLDLGFKPIESTGIILKPVVDSDRQGGESLKIECREGGVKRELSSPIHHTDLPSPLADVLERAEELIEHARATAPFLPEIRRPEASDMAKVDIDEFESTPLWVKEGTAYYWPACLSRPITEGDGIKDLLDRIGKLGELMLWACPELPDTASLTLVSCITTEDAPSLRCNLIEDLKRWSIERELAERALDLLSEGLAELLFMGGFILPVGHRTRPRVSAASGAAGLPVATIEVRRPDARRALEIDQEIFHCFDGLPTYTDPRQAVDRLDTLLATPHPVASELADQEGQAFTLKKANKDLGPDGYDEFSVAVAGGPQAHILERLVARVVGADAMAQYERSPHAGISSFSYSLIVAEAFDTNFRRPLGYATISGDLDCSEDGQLGGKIGDLPVTTYDLSICLEHIAIAGSEPVECRLTLAAAAIFAVRHLLLRMCDQAEAQSKHFEVDLHLSIREHGGSVIDDDLFEYVTSSMRSFRESLAKHELRRHLSIRDVVQECEVHLAA